MANYIVSPKSTSETCCNSLNENNTFSLLYLLNVTNVLKKYLKELYNNKYIYNKDKIKENYIKSKINYDTYYFYKMIYKTCYYDNSLGFPESKCYRMKNECIFDISNYFKQ